MANISSKYDINILPNRIKEVRKLRKYTQDQLATALNVSRQLIINWEKPTGTSTPSVNQLVGLCNVLDCSIDYLLGSVDTPEIGSISKAHHYSGIESEIIRYGLEHPDFLDCLNFFMHPKNSSEIFNSVTLAAWKKLRIESTINGINDELKEKLFSIFDEYISITPLETVNKKTYMKYLKQKLPMEKITLHADKTDSKIYIKKSVSLVTYQNFFTNNEFNYSSFINYLVNHTFDPLLHRMMLEIQKDKLAKKFADLFIRYLDAD